LERAAAPEEGLAFGICASREADEGGGSASEGSEVRSRRGERMENGVKNLTESEVVSQKFKLAE